MTTPCEPQTDEKRAEIYRQVKDFFHVGDTSGAEVFGAIHRISHLAQLIGSQADEQSGLSGPRWAIMLRLIIEEQRGNASGLTPTDISHHQRVSKNTISSLLRGLEEQGLIRRTIDPEDLRVFRIQLTDAGRTLIQQAGPSRIARLNRLLDGMSPEEQKQLFVLLNKLQDCLLEQACKNGEPVAEE